MTKVTLGVNPPQYHGRGDMLIGTRLEGTLLAEPVRRVTPKSRWLLELEEKQHAEHHSMKMRAIAFRPLKSVK